MHIKSIPGFFISGNNFENNNYAYIYACEVKICQLPERIIGNLKA